MYQIIRKHIFRRFKKTETKIHELNYLFWECTTRCNLSCLHCGSDCSKDNSIGDRLRNKKDSFSKVDRAIELAASSSRLNFDVVTCVNSRNWHELPALYDYLIQKKVKAWRLFSIVPIGRAKDNPELFLTDLQFKELMVLYQLVQISTGVLLRETFIRITLLKYGKPNIRHFVTGVGLNEGNAQNVLIIPIVREMDCTTGTKTKKMY